MFDYRSKLETAARSSRFGHATRTKKHQNLIMNFPRAHPSMRGCATQTHEPRSFGLVYIYIYEYISSIALLGYT